MKIPSSESRYYLKYGLKSDPFPTNAVDNILFLSPEINQGLDYLKDQIVNNNKTLVVLSPVGGGKTVLSNHIDAIKDPEWMLGHLKGNRDLDKVDISLAFLAQIFPDKKFDETQAIIQIHKFLESSSLNQRVPVFIIDDAHKLSDDGLEFILQLSELRFQESQFRFVLFATNLIQERLADEKYKELSEGKLEYSEIPLLTEEQTRGYIENRLSVCGDVNAYPFMKEDIQRIYQLSGGLPGGINLHASDAMKERNATKPSRNPPGFLVAVFALLLIVVAAGYYIYTGSSGPEPAAKDIAIAIPPPQPLKEIINPPQEIQASPEVETVSQTSTLPEKEKAPKPVPRAVPVIEPAEAIQTVSEKEKAPKPVPRPVPAIEPAVAIQAVVVEEQQKVTRVEPVSPPAAVIEDTAVSAPVAKEATRPIVQDEPAITSNSLSKSVGRDVDVKDIDSIVFNLPEVPETLTGIKGPDWLKQQNKGSFLLQIMSVKDVVNIEKMMTRLAAIKSELSGYTNYTPSGKARYLMYYGVYPDQDSANTAMNNLPSPLTSIKPWPRPLSSILKEIAKVQARSDIRWYTH